MGENYTPLQSLHSHKPPFLRILTLLAFALLIAVLSSLGTYWYIQNQQASKPPKEKEKFFCTQDAKACPDGSYVGRVPPSCEFAPCPTVAVNETKNWKSYTSTFEGISFKYPPNWKFTKIADAGDSPESVQIESPNNAKTKLLFVIRFDVIPKFQGSNNCLFTVVNELIIPSYKNLKIVAETYENSITGQLGLREENIVSGQSNQCVGPYFISKKNPDFYIQFFAGYIGGVGGTEEKQALKYTKDYKTFIDTEDVKAAIKVMESITYK